MIHAILLISIISELDQNCVMWSRRGECDKNTAYMWSNCKHACTSAGFVQKSYDERCPRNKNNPALKEGDVDKIFDRSLEF